MLDAHKGGVCLGEPVLSVVDLHKSIRGKSIIRGVTFDVYAGEVFGFLGPNGSGKTTTIRMLVDLIRPTSGTVRLASFDVHRDHDEAMQCVGCIVENPEMYNFMTGWQNLEHFAHMMPRLPRERIQEVTDIVGLAARIHDKVKTYSLGMRQRLGIAQALLGNPKLLILDEPTNGLDPQGIKELRVFIRSLAAQGMSVFVSSHLLSEVQLMCDRVAIISKGRILAVDRVDALLNRPVDEVVWAITPHSVALRVIEQCGYQDYERIDDVHVRIHMNREHIATLNEKLVFSGVHVASIVVAQPGLERLFLELTEGDTID
jgi:ABC-2 type transport system ATP-binding protein